MPTRKPLEKAREQVRKVSKPVWNKPTPQTLSLKSPS